MIRKRWLLLAAAVAGLSVVWLRPYLTLRSHRQTQFGLDPGVITGLSAHRSQLQDPQWGLRLLADPQVTDSRLKALADFDEHSGDNEALIKYRGEWALTYAGLRLQGRDNRSILEGAHGLEVTLATLAAEADPPAWWAGAGWLQKASGAKPQGSFRLGLLKAADVQVLVDRCEGLGEHQLPCLVSCVLRHEDGFTPEQRGRVLQAWDRQQSHFFNGNNARSLKRILEVRTKVMEFLGPPGDLKLELVPPAAFSEQEKAVCRATAEDFLRSCGYRIRPGAEARLELGLESVVFDEVATDYFVTYTARESRQKRTGSIRTGKDGVVPLYTSEEVEVEHKDRRSQTSQAAVPSLVWQMEREDRTARFSLPPYGDITQEQLQEMNAWLQADQLEDGQRRSFDFYLRNYAGATWRYGLRPYELDWNVEERLR
ncbi:hypothetical protein ABS71_04530 [bacterium SCN 62-11]|nr:hypothetical protein [Candidatus Eremiobacteraeota bacterium]ODT75354.1 MAG: hypothetical protein ABS71_04530 [bacterium SCN 62-11]